jgi:hypothetical protein
VQNPTGGADGTPKAIGGLSHEFKISAIHGTAHCVEFVGAQQLLSKAL